MALTPDRAVLQVLRDAGTMLDPFFARLFASAMGVFPVGCLVRLSDQSVGVVERPGEDPLAPQVRLTFDAAGTELEHPSTWISRWERCASSRSSRRSRSTSRPPTSSERRLPLRVLADSVQHQRDQRQPPAAVLAGLDELLNLVARVRAWGRSG